MHPVKSLIKLFMVLVAISASLSVEAVAGEYGLAVVSNRATVVVPAAGYESKTAWATNVVYSNGTYVVARGNTYMCMSTGTSTNVIAAAAAVFGGGMNISDGTVTWRRVKSGSRQSISIGFAAASGLMFVCFEKTAALNRGYMVPAGGSLTWTGPTCPQEDVSVFTTESGTVVVGER